MKTYKSDWSANNGNTYSSDCYTYTSLTQCRADMRRFARGEMHINNCNPNCGYTIWECDENGKRGNIIEDASFACGKWWPQ